MATFLLKQAPSAADRHHSVRLAFMVPLTETCTEFTRRFGIDVYTIFNMTEISSPIVSEPNPTRRGTCGRKRDGVDVRLVDANDCEVPLGEVGEMIVRTDRPWGMNHGYNKNPVATAEAWRNGWFHTGDCFRQDDDGYFYFVDRTGDTFRWKGENVSTTEVAEALSSYAGVAEANVYGVEVPGGEGKAGMAMLVKAEGFDLERLANHLEANLPSYARPVFLRFSDAVETTSTFKQRKIELQKEGFDPSSIGEPLFVRDAESGRYVALTPDLYAGICAGSVKT
jgi:crotonobetaine/carnitine-CoA ligase